MITETCWVTGHSTQNQTKVGIRTLNPKPHGSRSRDDETHPAVIEQVEQLYEAAYLPWDKLRVLRHALIYPGILPQIARVLILSFEVYA